MVNKRNRVFTVECLGCLLIYTFSINQMSDNKKYGTQFTKWLLEQPTNKKGYVKVKFADDKDVFHDAFYTGRDRANHKAPYIYHFIWAEDGTDADKLKLLEMSEDLVKAPDDESESESESELDDESESDSGPGPGLDYNTADEQSEPLPDPNQKAWAKGFDTTNKKECDDRIQELETKLISLTIQRDANKKAADDCNNKLKEVETLSDTQALKEKEIEYKTQMILLARSLNDKENSEFKKQITLLSNELAALKLNRPTAPVTIPVPTPVLVTPSVTVLTSHTKVAATTPHAYHEDGLVLLLAFMSAV